jgi:hypothetical protein
LHKPPTPPHRHEPRSRCRPVYVDAHPVQPAGGLRGTGVGGGPRRGSTRLGCQPGAGDPRFVRQEGRRRQGRRACLRRRDRHRPRTGQRLGGATDEAELATQEVAHSRPRRRAGAYPYDFAASTVMTSATLPSARHHSGGGNPGRVGQGQRIKRPSRYRPWGRSAAPHAGSSSGPRSPTPLLRDRVGSGAHRCPPSCRSASGRGSASGRPGPQAASHPRDSAGAVSVEV